MAFGESILAFLGLDTKGFEAKLGGAKGQLASFGKSAASLLGAGLSIAGIEHAISGVIEYGTRVQDLSDRFGVNAESLQKLGNAAELNGSSLEGMAKGFNKLEIAQSRALGGSSKVLAAFDNLGISLDDLKKMSPEELMLALGKSTLNAADVVTILGKSALELRPVLAGLADGTIEYGKAIDAIDIQRLKEADDLWKKIWQNVKIATGEFVALEATNWKGLWNDAVAGAEKLKHSGIDAWQAIQVEAGKAGFLSYEELQKLGLQWEEIGSVAEKAKRKFSPDSDGEGSKSKSQLAKEKKDRERTQLSLDELAKGPGTGPDEAFYNNIQAVYAQQQAQQVQQLEAESKRQALMQDPEGARRTLDRADTIRQSIGGLKESEKPLSKADLDSSLGTRYLASIDASLQLDE